jgi:hypothetical protein
MTAARDVWWEHPMGMVIDHQCPRDDRRPLWDTFTQWTAAGRSYRRRILGVDDGPKGASIEPEPDRVMDVPTGDAPDTRPDDERDDATVARYRAWGRLEMAVPKRLRWALSVAVSSPGALWKHNHPTYVGVLSLEGLYHLHAASMEDAGRSSSERKLDLYARER